MSVNLSSPAVEIRETRLGAITAYDGTASDCCNRSRGGGLCDKERDFTQCSNCSSGTAFCQLSLIQDAAVVNHGPIGCAADFPAFNFINRAGRGKRGLVPKNFRCINSNLEESDMVYGGAVKLEAAIKEAKKRFNPKAIFVTTSCASGIIGDDIYGITESIEDEIGVSIVPIFCEGFRSKIWATGFDAAYHGILTKIVKPPRQKRKDLINIINFWGEDIFSELLGKLGLTPNYIVPFSTIEQLETVSEAAATIQICSTLGTYFAAGLEQEYGVVEIKSPPPYGIKGTEIWLREIGRVTGKEKEVEELIKSEKERTNPQLKYFQENLKGKRAFVAAGAVHGQSLVAVLKELGVNVLGLSAWHHDQKFDNEDERADSLKHVVETYGDFNFNVSDKQAFEIVNALNRVKPDIFIVRHSGMSLWAAKLGIPTFIMGDEHFGLGFQGLLNYGQKVLDTISNPAFVKNIAAHTKLPYTNWWLEQEAAYFIGGE